jgi:hypothetical protein
MTASFWRCWVGHEVTGTVRHHQIDGADGEFCPAAGYSRDQSGLEMPISSLMSGRTWRLTWCFALVGPTGFEPVSPP